jgi:hypothetical protein
MVHLEGHEPAIDLVEESLADLDQHVHPVDGVVEGQHKGGTVGRDAEVAVVVSLGSNGEEPPTFGNGQNLRPPLIDPHATIVLNESRWSQGQRSREGAVQVLDPHTEAQLVHSQPE